MGGAIWGIPAKTAKVAGACTGDVTTYTYDAQDQLIQIDFPDLTSATYRYDGLGRRIEKNVDGTITRYVYDGPDILLEYDGANVLQARYSHGDQVDQPLALERSGQTYFYQSDHQGSVRQLTDSLGNIANSYTYDSYGRIEASSEAVPNPYLYTAREFDPESGLHFYRARYYDAEIGRFLKEDQIGFSSGDANLYRYVFNNPINSNDPEGLRSTSTGGTPIIRPGARGPSSYGPVGGRYGVDRKGLRLFPNPGRRPGQLEPRLQEPPLVPVPNPNPGPLLPSPTAPEPQFCPSPLPLPLPQDQQSAPTDEDREDRCDHLYYNIDIPICRQISKSRGGAAGARCYASAQARYAACLRGLPLPPLDTYNN